MIRDELEAQAELRKLLTNLVSAGVTGELAVSIRKAAEGVYRDFPSSNEVASLYERILRASQPASPPEPDSCRVLREKLNGPINTKTIIAALEGSGFRGRRDVSLREAECFRNIIHGPLQTLRGSNESAEGVPPERLQARIDSLREVLEALPPDIPMPRQVMETIIHSLELSTARTHFRHLLESLRRRVEQQDWDADAERSEAQSNLWAKENPTIPEVEEAHKHFARLEELQRAYFTQLAEADRVRQLIEEQKNYDRALNEIHLAEARLRQTRLRKREPLDMVLTQLVNRLAELYDWEERAAADPAPSEAVLEARLSNLQRLSVWLQKVPSGQQFRVEPLQQKCVTLMEQAGLQLNSMRLSRAREELRETPLEYVSAYVERLRFSDMLELRELAWKVQAVSDSLRHVNEGTRPVDKIHLNRLEEAEQDLGSSLLADAAREAARDYRTRAARDYLWNSVKLADAIENAGQELLTAVNPARLSKAIIAAAKSISEYRQRQEQETEIFTDTQQMFPEDCAALDQRVRHISQIQLPEAVNRWADLILTTSRSQQDIVAARRSFAAWHDVLGHDFPHAEIERRFDERSAEMEILVLEAAGKIDEALRFLEDKRKLLSDRLFLESQRRLGRRLAVLSYQPGGEGEIAAAIREQGPDSELLSKLTDDFLARGDCQHLASIYQCLQQIEAVDRHAALLVRWSFDFKSEDLNGLAQSLASSEASDSVSMFAKAIAASESHAAALRVLDVLLKMPAHWGPDIRDAVEASYKILFDKFTDTCNRFEIELRQLRERCDPNQQPPDRRDSKNDAELQQQIEEAFARANVFLDQAIPQVSGWHDYLSTTSRFGVECESSLITSVQELDAQLLANRQFLDRLSSARRAVVEMGWEKLADLHRILNGNYTSRIAPVAAVFQLLLKYLENYQPTTQIVGQLVDAWRGGGDGLSRELLTQLIKRLTEELDYDFRRGQDRFQQVVRFYGRSFREFVEELEAMVAELEAVASYEDQLKGALVGREETLRLRVKRGLESDRQEIDKVLRHPDFQGKTLLDLYHNPPGVSKSPVAVERLRALRDAPWFDLLRQAILLTENLMT